MVVQTYIEGRNREINFDFRLSFNTAYYASKLRSHFPSLSLSGVFYYLLIDLPVSRIVQVMSKLDADLNELLPQIDADRALKMGEKLSHLTHKTIALKQSLSELGERSEKEVGSLKSLLFKLYRTEAKLHTIAHRESQLLKTDEKLLEAIQGSFSATIS